MQQRRGDEMQILEEKDLLSQESITVIFQPVVEVETNQVFGYKTLICNSEGAPNTPDPYRRCQSIGELNELKLSFLNIQLQKAQEMGLDRVFIHVDSYLLREMESISKPPGMEVVFEITDLELLGDIQTCQGIFVKWRAQGIQFAVDDFGSGFISLPIIACLMPEYIKFDLSGMVQAVPFEELKEIYKDLLLALRNYSRKGIFYTP